MPKNKDLRVWWIPQVPGVPFHVPVESVEQAKFVLDLLGRYDQFQFDNRIKGDYANVGGLEEFDTSDQTGSPNGSWVEWYDDDGYGIGETCS